MVLIILRYYLKTPSELIGIRRNETKIIAEIPVSTIFATILVLHPPQLCNWIICLMPGGMLLFNIAVPGNFSLLMTYDITKIINCLHSGLRT